MHIVNDFLFRRSPYEKSVPVSGAAAAVRLEIQAEDPLAISENVVEVVAVTVDSQGRPVRAGHGAFQRPILLVRDNGRGDLLLKQQAQSLAGRARFSIHLQPRFHRSVRVGVRLPGAKQTVPTVRLNWNKKRSITRIKDILQGLSVQGPSCPSHVCCGVSLHAHSQRIPVYETSQSAVIAELRSMGNEGLPSAGESISGVLAQLSLTPQEKTYGRGKAHDLPVTQAAFFGGWAVFVDWPAPHVGVKGNLSISIDDENHGKAQGASPADVDIIEPSLRSLHLEACRKGIAAGALSCYWPARGQKLRAGGQTPVGPWPVDPGDFQARAPEVLRLGQH